MLLLDCYNKEVSSSLANKYKTQAIILAAITGTLYSLWLLGYWLNPAIMNNMDLSALQAAGQPHFTFFVAGDVLTGVASISLAYQLIVIFNKSKTLKSLSPWFCLSGIAIFGIFTAISALLPSCIASSKVCNANMTNVLDVHDITGVIASLGIFIGLSSALKLTYKDIKLSWYRATLILQIAWCLSGIIFVILSIKLINLSLAFQQVFLILSSLCIIMIAVIINMKTMNESIK